MEAKGEFKKLIELGIKAPSGHNSQPWKFKITNNSIDIYPDFNNSLSVVDPSNRELFVSLGCAGENIRVAAWSLGYSAEWSLNTESNRERSISFKLKKMNFKANDSILKTIKERQSNRNVFNGKSIEENDLETLRKVPLEKGVNIYFFKKGCGQFNTIKDYISKGNEIQMTDSNFKKELLSWIRFNKRQVEKTNNGLSYKVMGAPAMPTPVGKKVFGLFLNPIKQNKGDMKKIESSSHFILLTTDSNTIGEWISLGFSLERLLLILTELGIANAFLNPPCEIDKLSYELGNHLGIDNEYPTIIMRVGYANKTPYSSRRKIEDVLLDA
ncbi:Acg family FMN-binding oxidoreductase [Maribacter sp. 2308TA10-17]|uniref:Acg family FMN-binding oxidoreductase n=1 Tax=Maribacter sp. 2308TA10-17 TaxID=3386276 RepID=UPI0039BC28C1